ncbi:MAG: ATP-binding cassette domain-containing protein [Deltaproteobacteria bacterium]|nr:ATP-binding cassette domain-containing protein [Deltaproteobacteria bacterium]MBW2577641.1 ATP-binding cassette domain-containing protein [Deltaproteobacteria bacterium]MBW2691509.1 ATP-binding cassette domain-containing protein [Deltaproteobacteria bacterium]
MSTESPLVEIRGLTMTYGDFVVQRDLDFAIQRGEIFVVMGTSGCGKTTLLRHLVGLRSPAKGEVLYEGEDFWGADPERRQLMMRRFGVMYQNGALWSSMTLAENVSLPLEVYTDLSRAEIREIALFKLALMGLAGFGDFHPSEVSGGMQKRVGVARAMALDPDILYFDEPSAGLDPVSARRLDDLIRELRDSLGITMVIVTHELDSIFAVADRSVFLDPDTHTMLAIGSPAELRDHSPDPKIRQFLNRGRL